MVVDSLGKELCNCRRRWLYHQTMSPPKYEAPAASVGEVASDPCKKDPSSHIAVPRVARRSRHFLPSACWKQPPPETLELSPPPSARTAESSPLSLQQRPGCLAFVTTQCRSAPCFHVQCRTQGALPPAESRTFSIQDIPLSSSLRL